MRLSIDVRAVSLSAAIFLLAIYWLSIDIGAYSTFHRDEAKWIAISKFAFNSFFVRRSFDDSTWIEPLHGYGPESPPLGKYMVGASLSAFGFAEFTGMPLWDASKDLEWHIERGFVPSQPELVAARIPSALMAAATAACIAYVVSIWMPSAIGYVAAAISAIAFLLHPVTEVMARRAMFDLPVSGFAILALAALLSYREGANQRSLPFDPSIILAALFAAFAISTKLNGGLVVLSVSAVAILRLVEQRNRRAAISLTLAIILPATVFVALDPALWPDLKGGLTRMIEFGQKVAADRIKYPGVAIWTLGDSVSSLLSHVFFRFPPMLLAVLAPFAFGEKMRLAIPISVWTLVITAGAIAWTPFAFQRYYAMPVAIFAVLFGIALASLLVRLDVLRSNLSKRIGLDA